MKRIVRRAGSFLVALSAGYLMLLAYPQPLFAYEVTDRGLTIRSTRPLPDAIRATLARANARLQRSPLYDPGRVTQVFLCDAPPLFALFARQNYQVGGIADWAVGQHVFLRASDVANDRLISPAGTPVSADRPLSYFIAHEAMHIAIVRQVGRARYSRLPQWLDDGYADYIARDIDIASALRQMKEGARELDPRRSGLYLRYHLMVWFLLETKGVPLEQLLLSPPDRESIERELMSLTS